MAATFPPVLPGPRGVGNAQDFWTGLTGQGYRRFQLPERPCSIRYGDRVPAEGVRRTWIWQEPVERPEPPLGGGWACLDRVRDRRSFRAVATPSCRRGPPPASSGSATLAPAPVLPSRPGPPCDPLFRPPARTRAATTQSTRPRVTTPSRNSGPERERECHPLPPAIPEIPARRATRSGGHKMIMISGTWSFAAAGFRRAKAAA